MTFLINQSISITAGMKIRNRAVLYSLFRSSRTSIYKEMRPSGIIVSLNVNKAMGIITKNNFLFLREFGYNSSFAIRYRDTMLGMASVDVAANEYPNVKIYPVIINNSNIKTILTQQKTLLYKMLTRSNLTQNRYERKLKYPIYKSTKIL